MDDLKRIERSALSRAKRAKNHQDLAQLRSEVLGKEGSLGAAMKTLGTVPPEERPKLGQKINQVKVKIEEALAEAKARVEAADRDRALLTGAYDVTLPGRRLFPGAPHPLRIIEQDVVRSLSALGFTVAEGPLVEHDWYNFEALNMPPDHPARDMQDTFFLGPNTVLRTHTSNVQIRTMMAKKPPVRVLAPGMVFRKDALDATHSPVFHQIEGLWIDEKATFADLKGVLKRFVSHLFGPDTQIRLRPSFFPFTEPSVEVDVQFRRRPSGPGPMITKGTGWLEILGAGMVHPNVLEAVGYDPERCQGFAFGVGLERLAMLRWSIDDIRLLYENDVRFLEQFASRAGG